jgi:hypothetical protein
MASGRHPATATSAPSVSPEYFQLAPTLGMCYNLAIEALSIDSIAEDYVAFIVMDYLFVAR